MASTRCGFQHLFLSGLDFAPNPKIKRLLDAKAEAYKSGANIDWSLGEGLAFASLLAEGYPVRISGQDCERGTFSHRHAALVDGLEARGLRDNTLILCIWGDNGSSAEGQFGSISELLAQNNIQNTVEQQLAANM